MGGILFTVRVCFMGKLKRIIGNNFVCVWNDVGAGAWSKCKQSQLIYYKLVTVLLFRILHRNQREFEIRNFIIYILVGVWNLFLKLSF